jgi:transcription initiation factor TFIID subunit 5
MGHYFVSGGFDRTARLWALDCAHPRRLLVGHAADVDSVAWHPTCSYVATGSADRTVRLWDVASGECVRLFSGHRAVPRALAFCPGGKRLASAADDGGVVLWELESARTAEHWAAPEKEAGPEKEAPAARGANSLCWSAEGAMLACGTEDGVVRVWQPVAGGAAAAAGGPGEMKLVSTFRTLPGTQMQVARFSQANLLFVAGSR